MFGEFSGRVSRWLDYRRTVSELSRLTDQELSDLGINRYDIKRVARRSAH